MDLKNALDNGVNITYKPIAEIPLPEGVVFDRWLFPGVAVVSGAGLRHSDEHGVFSAEKGMLTPLSYHGVEKSPSGLILLRHKKGSHIMTRDGQMIAGSECDDARELGEGFFAKKTGKTWAVCRLSDGAQITAPVFTSVSDFSEGTCAVTIGKEAQLIGTDGAPAVPGSFEFAAPFKNGFARVGMKKDICYIDRSGRTVFSGAARGSRDFTGGYAVIRDLKGNEGAIDTDGNVVIPPQYRFMRDAEEGFFVVSNSGSYQADGVTFKGRNYGLIAADGREILPLKYGSVKRSGGIYQFGDMAVWQKNEGSRVTNYGVLVFGEIDCTGRQLLAKKYVSVAEASEGLRAYKTFIDPVLSFGYMTEDGTPAFEIGSIDYSRFHDPERSLLREDISLQLGPFRGGRARVCIAPAVKEVGIFNKTWESTVEQTGWYEIDRTGARLDDTGSDAVNASAILQGGRVPFEKTYRDFTGNALVNKAMVDASLEINPFDEMREVSFTFGFAILDQDGKCVCGSDDGLPSQPFAYIYQSKEAHERYYRLTQLTQNVWLAVTKDGEKIIFSEFESPTRFSCGLAPFRKLGPKNQFLWGYMDHRGRVLVEPRYNTATGFEDGYACVSVGRSFSILRREAVVTEKTEERPDPSRLLKEEIAAWTKDPSDSRRGLRITELFRQGSFEVPVTAGRPEDRQKQVFCLKSTEGKKYFPAFTSRDETDPSFREHVSWEVMSGQQIIDAVRADTTFSGVVINAYSQAFTFVP